MRRCTHLSEHLCRSVRISTNLNQRPWRFVRLYVCMYVVRSLHIYVCRHEDPRILTNIRICTCEGQCDDERTSRTIHEGRSEDRRRSMLFDGGRHEDLQPSANIHGGRCDDLPMLIFSMEAGTCVYARMKVSAKTSEPHRRSMDVGTKIDEDQCFSMEVDTRVPT
jgi:hypothetical protein